MHYKNMDKYSLLMISIYKMETNLYAIFMKINAYYKRYYDM